MYVYLLQFYEEENIRGVVSLNEEWELEDFSNTEEVCLPLMATPIKISKILFLILY